MKRLFFLAIAAALLLTACAGPGAPEQTGAPESTDAAEPEEIDLSLWTHPVGGWGSGSTVSAMVSAFTRDHPEIHISVRILTYDTGDSDIEAAIAGGEEAEAKFQEVADAIARFSR